MGTNKSVVFEAKSPFEARFCFFCGRSAARQARCGKNQVRYCQDFGSGCKELAANLVLKIAERAAK